MYIYTLATDSNDHQRTTMDKIRLQSTYNVFTI